MKNKFLSWQSKYTKKQKISTLIIQGIFFIFVLPTILFYSSKRLDYLFGFSKVLITPLNIYLGLIPFIIGLFLSFWAVWVQFKIGSGTPAPPMPTQKLVKVPPYTYCRNPMGLGFGIWFLGFGLIFNSLSFILADVVLFILLLLYYKFIEEKELEMRFGEEYIEYKKQVPFLIPNFRKSRI